MSHSAPPPAPRGTKAAGRRLWRAIVRDYDLADHELAILAQAARVADMCDELEKTTATEGMFLDGKVHPAVVELRLQRILLARLIVALRVPLGEVEDESAPRTQYRGVRGVYGGAA